MSLEEAPAGDGRLLFVVVCLSQLLLLLLLLLVCVPARDKLPPIIGRPIGIGRRELGERKSRSQMGAHFVRLPLAASDAAECGDSSPGGRSSPPRGQLSATDQDSKSAWSQPKNGQEDVLRRGSSLLHASDSLAHLGAKTGLLGVAGLPEIWPSGEQFEPELGAQVWGRKLGPLGRIGRLRAANAW